MRDLCQLETTTISGGLTNLETTLSLGLGGTIVGGFIGASAYGGGINTSVGAAIGNMVAGGLGALYGGVIGMAVGLGLGLTYSAVSYSWS